MNSIQKLIELFTKFPGIGPRQAGRFVYFLLSSSQSYRTQLTRLLNSIKVDTKVCPSCSRFHSYNTPQCAICVDTKRDASVLMLVEKDVDLDNIERAKEYNGYYFVMGGTIPILDKDPRTSVRIKELEDIITKRAQAGLKEIILAFSVNAEGENTITHIRKILEPLITKYSVKLSTLGRGLSTGSELEYSDSETIKNALKNRA